MRIESGQIYNANLDEIGELASRAKARISFWGTKYLSLDKSRKWISADSLKLAFIDAVRHNAPLSDYDKKLGEKVLKQINRCISEFSAFYEGMGYFTYICVEFRLFFLYALRDWYSEESPYNHGPHITNWCYLSDGDELLHDTQKAFEKVDFWQRQPYNYW